MRVLLIGPVDVLDRHVGGAPRTTRRFRDALETAGLLGRVVDTRRYYGPAASLRNLGYTLAATALAARRHDLIVFLGARRGMLHLAPIVWCICKLVRCPLAFKPIGGDFFDLYDQSFPAHRAWQRATTFRSALLLLETKSMCRRAEREGIRHAWHPNCRPAAPFAAESREFSARFVFLSRVVATKGVGEVLSVRSRIDGITLDIAGPIDDSAYLPLQNEPFYHGVIAPDATLQFLSQYDVLVLPTYFSGEGYPGVILEAFSLGMPVITTRWMGIPDIVPESAGIVIEPRAPDDLERAIRSIDARRFAELAEGARAAFRHFDCARANRELVASLTGLVASQND